MALSLTMKDRAGADAGKVDLDPAIFAVQPNVPVMHQVVTAQLAAARSGTQSTKTRSEVAGGGAKPWRQKGTGRARQGSIRSPQWVGGGVALGPKPRSYAQRTPKKMVRLALWSALSDRASSEKIVVVSSWGLEAPKTKDAKAVLNAIGVSGKILVVLARGDEASYKSFRNLTDVHIIMADQLNAYDVLVSDWVVFTPDTLPTASAGDTKAAAQPKAPGQPKASEPVVSEAPETSAPETSEGEA